MMRMCPACPRVAAMVVVLGLIMGYRPHGGAPGVLAAVALVLAAAVLSGATVPLDGVDVAPPGVLPAEVPQPATRISRSARGFAVGHSSRDTARRRSGLR